VVRERRRLWSSRPSGIVIASSIAELSIIVILAGCGLLMARLPLAVMAGLAAVAVVFAFVLDLVKNAIFRQLKMD
jgi:H+-transporting ATPase